MLQAESRWWTGGAPGYTSPTAAIAKGNGRSFGAPTPSAARTGEQYLDANHKHTQGYYPCHCNASVNIDGIL